MPSIVRSIDANLHNLRSFNQHSPMNVPAGQGSINLEKVIAHYEKKNYEAQEKQMQQLKDGTLRAEIRAREDR
jgi:hypothetical protein